MPSTLPILSITLDWKPAFGKQAVSSRQRRSDILKLSRCSLVQCICLIWRAKAGITRFSASGLQTMPV